MSRVWKQTSAEKPEPPGRRPGSNHAASRALILFAGSCLVVYGGLATLIASLWGPGNSDELVGSGPELVPWFGLAVVGMLAAVVALVRSQQTRSAGWALLVAALCLGAWTAFLFLIT